MIIHNIQYVLYYICIVTCCVSQGNSDLKQQGPFAPTTDCQGIEIFARDMSRETLRCRVGEISDNWEILLNIAAIALLDWETYMHGCSKTPLYALWCTNHLSKHRLIRTQHPSNVASNLRIHHGSSSFPVPLAFIDPPCPISHQQRPPF